MSADQGEFGGGAQIVDLRREGLESWKDSRVEEDQSSMRFPRVNVR